MFINNVNTQYTSTNYKQTKTQYEIKIYDKLFYHYATTNDIPKSKITIKNQVLEIDLNFEIVNNYRLPLNHFIVNINSTLGDFNNIPVKELSSRPYKTILSFENAKITSYSVSIRIDLRKVGLVNKPVYKKRLDFSFNIAVNPHVINDDVNTSEAFNWATFTKQLNIRWDKANTSYLYSNFFNLEEIDYSDNEIKTNKSYPDLVLPYEFKNNQKTIKLVKNQTLKILPAIHYLKRYQQKDMKVALREVAYELSYLNLSNQSKVLKWTQAQLNLEQLVNNQINLQIDKGMHYDFLKDELVFDDKAYQQIWLPKRQKAKLKVFLTTNYETTKIHFIEFILDFLNDFTAIEKPILKVYKAEIDDYENFKEVI